jgi:hypothetical protein
MIARAATCTVSGPVTYVVAATTFDSITTCDLRIT